MHSLHENMQIQHHTPLIGHKTSILAPFFNFFSGSLVFGSVVRFDMKNLKRDCRLGTKNFHFQIIRSGLTMRKLETNTSRSIYDILGEIHQESTRAWSKKDITEN